MRGGIVPVVAAAALAVAGCSKQKQPTAGAEKAAAKPQTICPVMGGAVNRNIYVDHQSERVYFCCQACVAEFKKDPEKYIGKLEAEGVELEDAPAAGSSERAPAGVEVEHEGPGARHQGSGHK